MFPLKMVDLSIVFCMFTRGYHDFRKLPRSKLKMIIGERQGNSKIQPFLKTRIVLLDISHHVPHHSWLCIYIYIIYIIYIYTPMHSLLFEGPVFCDDSSGAAIWLLLLGELPLPAGGPSFPEPHLQEEDLYLE